MQARQAAQEQEHPDEATLVQQYGLQPTGARVTAEIPGLEPVTGTVQGIEADPESGGYALRLLADDGEVYIVTGEDGGVVRPAAVGAGTREAPLQAADGRDVDAAVQENTNPGSSPPKNTAQESNARQTWGAKEGLVSRYFLQVILIAMLGSCTYFSWQSIFDRDGPESLSTRQAVDAQKAAEARRQVLKNSVVEMAAKVNAVTNWASNLADGRDRQSSILTAELQKQWVISRPILLLGNIQDIALNSDATYQVVVAHDPFSTTNTLFFPDIRMSLRCPESVAAPLIQAAKKESASPMGAITAVTAVIESIVTTRETDAKGEADTVMTGIGKCLDAMYLTERISWP